MSPSADDRPNESANAPSASADLPSGALDAPRPSSSDLPKRDILTLPEGAAPSLAPAGDQPQRRRRRRRRRKGPRPPGAPGQGPSAEARSPMPAGDIQAAPSANGAMPEAVAPGEALAADGAALPGSAPAGQPAGEHPPKRRRRRRRKPRPAGAAAPGGEIAASPDGANTNGVSPAAGTAPHHAGDAPPGREQRPRGHGRGRRDFRSRENRPPQAGAAATPDGAAPSRAPRERDRDRPAKGPRDRDARDRKPGDRDRRDGGKRSFGGGKGRDDFRRKPEPKLYSFESVVDRGFEEVADPANEGEMQRVAWTIVKRTLADQKAAKTVSAAYLLKRGEAVTEFANLAAARAAVNKTIVHPEKLTRAKADYGSSKK